MAWRGSNGREAASKPDDRPAALAEQRELFEKMVAEGRR